MEITRNSRLKDVIETASGHDIIARLLYSLGMDLDAVRRTPLGLLKIGSLKRLSFGKLSDASVDALIEILNSLKDEDPGEDGTVRQLKPAAVLEIRVPKGGSVVLRAV